MAQIIMGYRNVGQGAFTREKRKPQRAGWGVLGPRRDPSQ